MIPLRLVVDTNIVVSAALKPEGLQRTVLLLAITKPARLYVSAAIFAEYRDVLSRQELQIRKGLRRICYNSSGNAPIGLFRRDASWLRVTQATTYSLNALMLPARIIC